MKYYLKLIRWPNLIIIIITMLSIRYGVIYPLIKIYGFDLQLSLFDFILLMFATVLIAAGGYVINDYFDRRIDMENKPDDVIVTTHIARRSVMSLHNTLTGIGLLFGFVLSYRIDQNSFSILFIIISGALWFYSTLYKRQLLVGNILVSVLTALVPLMVMLYDVPLIIAQYRPMIIQNIQLYKDIHYMMYAVLLFSGFAFLTTMSREIIKDIQDFEGDSTCQRKTVPIVWGVKIAKIIALIFLALTLVALGFIYHIFLQNDLISLIYIILVLSIPILILMVLILKAHSSKDFKFCSQILKLIMVLGLLLVIPFYLYITSSMA